MKLISAADITISLDPDYERFELRENGDESKATETKTYSNQTFQIGVEKCFQELVYFKVNIYLFTIMIHR